MSPLKASPKKLYLHRRQAIKIWQKLGYVSVELNLEPYGTRRYLGLGTRAAESLISIPLRWILSPEKEREREKGRGTERGRGGRSQRTDGRTDGGAVDRVWWENQSCGWKNVKRSRSAVRGTAKEEAKSGSVPSVPATPNSSIPDLTYLGKKRQCIYDQNDPILNSASSTEPRIKLDVLLHLSQHFWLESSNTWVDLVWLKKTRGFSLIY